MADSNIAGLPAGAAIADTDLIAGSDAGSGTLVKKTGLQFNTYIRQMLAALPTTDPHVNGTLWNNGGLVAISFPFLRSLAGATGTYAMTGSAATLVFGGGPTFSVDFTTISSLPAAISFSRASTGTYFDSSGVLQTAAIDAPRFDHSPATLAGRGILIEEPRTNVVTNSNNFGAWTTDTTGSITSTTRPAPDGTNTASTLSTSGSGGRAYILWSDSGSGSAVHSIWIRRRTGTGIVKMWDPSQTDVDITSQITSTWTRVSVTATGGGSAHILVSLATAGDEVDLFGAQVERGSFATSYIPTTTVAVTRSGDIASMLLSALSFNTSTGSFLAEIEVTSRNDEPPYRGLYATCDNSLTIGTATLTNRLDTFKVKDAGGTAQFNREISTGIHRSVLAYDIAVGSSESVNGAAPNALTPFSLPLNVTTGVTKIQFGRDVVFDYLSGWVRSFAYYDTRISDPNLQIKSVVGAAF